MGGLLAADALVQFVQSRPDTEAPLWPRIVACLAFDTPVSTLSHHTPLHLILSVPWFTSARFQTWRNKSC